MSDNKAVMIPPGFSGGVSKVFANAPVESLGEGIRSGFGIIGYKGKVWSTKYQGVETPMMREDGDGPRASIEVVIVKSSPHIAKIYYESGFVDGSTAPPDCWSATGITPDAASPKKQSATCAGCPKNAWGSKTTEAGKQTKACGDSKRMAIVPLNDIKNDAMGGPMLLRVPAASLKDLKMYGDTLQSYGVPYYAAATRIGFDHNEAYPKFTFSAIRPLSDTEAQMILELRDDARVTSILSEQVTEVHHEPEAAQVPKSPFENAQNVPAAVNPALQPVVAQPAQVAQQQTVAAQPQVQTAAAEPQKRKRRTKAEMEAAAAALKAQREGAPAPVTQSVTNVGEEAEEVEEQSNANLDALLDSVLPS